MAYLPWTRGVPSSSLSRMIQDLHGRDSLVSSRNLGVSYYATDTWARSHAAVFESQIKERSCLHRTVLTDANALKTSKDLETHLKAWPCPACTVEPFVSTAVVTLPVPILSTVKLQADKDEQYSANWTGTNCPALQRGPPKLSCLMQTCNINLFHSQIKFHLENCQISGSCQSPTEDKAGTF